MGFRPSIKKIVKKVMEQEEVLTSSDINPDGSVQAGASINDNAPSTNTVYSSSKTDAKYSPLGHRHDDIYQTILENSGVLEKLSEANGSLLFNGAAISGGGTGTGDLTKAVADTYYEPKFSKGTAFNKNFGTLATQVAVGNHLHTGVYEPIITTKGSAFNKDFAGSGTAATVARSDHSHSELHTHTNATTLSKLSDNGTELLFNGAVVGGTQLGGGTVPEDVYTKDEVDTLLDGKADVSHTHTDLASVPHYATQAERPESAEEGTLISVGNSLFLFDATAGGSESKIPAMNANSVSGFTAYDDAMGTPYLAFDGASTVYQTGRNVTATVSATLGIDFPSSKLVDRIEYVAGSASSDGYQPRNWRIEGKLATDGTWQVLYQNTNEPDFYNNENRAYTFPAVELLGVRFVNIANALANYPWKVTNIDIFGSLPGTWVDVTAGGGSVDLTPYALKTELHSHDNASVLNALSDSSGQLAYNGVVIEGGTGGGGLTQAETDLLYADITHTHEFSDVNGLTEAIDMIGNVGSKTVDETNIGDNKILSYDLASDTVQYVDMPAGGSGGSVTRTVQEGIIAPGGTLTVPFTGVNPIVQVLEKKSDMIIGSSDITPTVGGSPISSAVSQSYVAANAFDNNTSTLFGTANAGTGQVNNWGYIGYNFGTGNKYKVRKVTFRQQATPDGNVTAVMAQYSTDGTTWTDIQQYAVGANLNTLDVPATTNTYQYFRLLAKSNTGTNTWSWNTLEMELFVEVPGPVFVHKPNYTTLDVTVYSDKVTVLNNDTVSKDVKVTIL